MIEHQNVTVSKRLIVVNSVSSIGAKLINMTVILWMYQYLLKRIPADEFAVYPVVAAVMVFAPLFFSMFSGGVSRYVIEAYAKGEFEKVTRIISSIAPMMTAAATIFLFVGLLFSFNIERILNIAPQMVEEARIMMALLVGSFALQMIALPFSVGFHVRQRYLEFNIIGVARDLLRTLLLFVLLVGIGAQVIWVVVATVIAEFVYIVVVVVRSRRMLPGLSVRPGMFSWKQSWALMSFGVWTTVGQLGAVMYTNAATIVLNLYGTAADVTSYYLGATFYRQLLSTIQLASLPLQPALTAMHALADYRRLRNAVLRGGRYASWVALAVATPLAIYSEDFIALYLGDRYPNAAFVLILFMAIFPFSQPNVLLSKVAMATGRVREFFLPAFLFQLTGLGLMFVLAAYFDFGAIGVTLSLTAITVASQLLYFWRMTLRVTGLSFRTFAGAVLRPSLMPALGGSVAWVALKVALPPQTWYLLGLNTALGGLVYLALLLLFCLDEGDRRDLRVVLDRLLRRV